MNKRNFLKCAALAAAPLGLPAAASAAGSSAAVPSDTPALTSGWDKVFPKNPNVDHKKITFKNRYGFTVAGDLYTPKGVKAGVELPAIAVSGPFGAVKEQSSGLYAQEMASRGFVTLAFDPSWTGESSGLPRNMASPDVNTEDFSAAVDALGILPIVDQKRIGIIGICGFGGFALNAAAMDTRVRAVASVVMYDMSRAMGWGVGAGRDRYTEADRRAVKAFLNEKRWEDAAKGSIPPGGHDLPVDKAGRVTQGDRILPETLPENPDPVLKEFFDYYRVKRGFHPRSVNSTSAWCRTMPLSFMNMPLLTYIKEISPRPVLIITGEKAHSRYFAETAFRNAAEPKELVIIPGANHVDLYDRKELIPFAKLESFFTKNLAPSAASR